jgi:hypothetical protein
LQGPFTKVNAQPRYEKVENNKINSRKKERRRLGKGKKLE